MKSVMEIDGLLILALHTLFNSNAWSWDHMSQSHLDKIYVYGWESYPIAQINWVAQHSYVISLTKYSIGTQHELQRSSIFLHLLELIVTDSFLTNTTDLWHWIWMHNSVTARPMRSAKQELGYPEDCNFFYVFFVEGSLEGYLSGLFGADVTNW